MPEGAAVLDVVVAHNSLGDRYAPTLEASQAISTSVIDSRNG